MLLKEIAEEYGVSIHALRNAASSGRLPTEKINGRRHVNRRDYENFRRSTTVRSKKINAKQCEQCRYGMMFTGADWCCNYLEITGRMRECDTYPKCEKFEEKKKKRNKPAT